MVCGLGRLLAAAGEEPLLTRLSPAARLRVLLALAALLLLGLAMILVVRTGARIARRYGRWQRSASRQSTAPDEDDWSRKPLAP
jgi:hypothetical protein